MARKPRVPSTSTTTPPPTPYKGPVAKHHLTPLVPMTDTQRAFCAAYESRAADAFVLHGVAGTGKTFLALAKALQDILTTPGRRIVLLRSAVPSRDIGFLPGNEAEKMSAYQKPYLDLCARLVNHPQGFQKLQQQQLVEFWSTSYVRGLTIDDAVIIVDECQNMSDMELNSIMTRVGQRSTIVFCGDFRQTDLKKSSDLSGLSEFMQTVALMPMVAVFEFGLDDIVRSPLVKAYLTARLRVKDSIRGH
jgi:phosphate starvation-inducible protein PhoH